MASLTEFTHRYNPQPRLSAYQISEYLSANATNRKRILQEAKYPSTMIVIRYEDARSPVASHMAGSDAAIDDALLRLRRKADDGATTDYVRQNCDLCAGAMESFQAAIGNLDVGKTKFRIPDLHNTKIKLAGVNISVSIDMMTEETDRTGKRSVGAAMLIFSKPAKPAKNMEERCTATALLIYQLLKTQASTAAICDPTLCMAIDVFNAKIYRAKKQHKQLLKTVETSCEEVAIRWPSVEPPTSYNGPPILKSA